MALVGVQDSDGEETLEQIIWDIYVYLQGQGVTRFSRFLGKRGPRAGASWTEVNIQLRYFVKDPKNQYSKTMTIIETEKAKFSDETGYVHRLIKLEDFLRQAPKFSKDYDCLVRVPDGFKKRRSKTKIGFSED